MRFFFISLEAENRSLHKVNEDLSIEVEEEKSIEVELGKVFWVRSSVG